MNHQRTSTITKRSDSYLIEFFAMASPCEAIIETADQCLAKQLADLVANEVWRIEDKFSRYDNASVCSHINNNVGHLTAIDQETFLLLNFANTCYELSDGLFDITSGVLRKVWHFDGSSNIPTQDKVREIQQHVDWRKVRFDQGSISMPSKMELDFGGIGKEYAVDKCIQLAKNLTNQPVLINLGGDLASTASRSNNQPWQVGIEHPGFESSQPMVVLLYKGALATSGDAKRYLIKDGKRYSHILNAKTGWPVEQAPKSITVNAPQCVQAGIIATLAMLQGENAEHFLVDQEIKHWLIR